MGIDNRAEILRRDWEESRGTMDSGSLEIGITGKGSLVEVRCVLKCIG